MSEKIKRNQRYPDHKIIPKKTSAELADDIEAFLKNGGEIVNAPIRCDWGNQQIAS